MRFDSIQRMERLYTLDLLARRTDVNGPFPAGCRVRFITAPPADPRNRWLPRGHVVPEGDWVPPTGRRGPGLELGQRARVLGDYFPGNLIAIQVNLTCNGYSRVCAKACGCRIDPCFHLPAKQSERFICPCGNEYPTRQALLDHRYAVARTRCCAAARVRPPAAVTPRNYRIRLCPAREVWRSYARDPNLFIRIDHLCTAHGTAAHYAAGYVPTHVKTPAALAVKQERWRQAKNWERRRHVLVCVARAAAAASASKPCPRGCPDAVASGGAALRRGLVRLYRGMASSVLRRVMAHL